MSEDKRFAGDVHLRNNPRALVLHYEPLPGSKSDRFGNRLFVSPDLSYVDREGQNIKAALLISSRGEGFVKEHPGILSEIDSALAVFNPEIITAESQRLAQVELKKGGLLRKLSADKQGHQSITYVLEIGDKKYIIKTPGLPFGKNYRQPYLNEMLQIQSVSTDLNPLLNDCGVRLPANLFASGQVLCEEFEEGRSLAGLNEGATDEISSRIRRFRIGLEEYVGNKRKQGVALWKDIKLDTGGKKFGVIKVKNYLLGDDNILVCVDPFYYDPKE